MDADDLSSLLKRPEGETIDFKANSYNLSDSRQKRNFAKDLASLVNTPRVGEAHLVLGVKRRPDGSTELSGIKDEIDDADLQGVAFSLLEPTPRFSYRGMQHRSVRVGLITIPSGQQFPVAPKKTLDEGFVKGTIYFRRGSKNDVASIPEQGRIWEWFRSQTSPSRDSVQASGQDSPPRAVTWSIDRLRNMAKHAVVATAKQWQEHPIRHSEYGSGPRDLDFAEARRWVLRMMRERRIDADDYPDGIDSYASLHWVFRNFEDLGAHCTQTIRTVGAALIESGALMRAITVMEDAVHLERQAWEGFVDRMDDELAALPGQANYNLLSLAIRAVRFVDVLDDKDHYGDPNYDSWNRFQPIPHWHSPQWGDWN